MIIEAEIVQAAKELGHSEHAYPYRGAAGAAYLVGAGHLHWTTDPASGSVGIRCDCGWVGWVGQSPNSKALASRLQQLLSEEDRLLTPEARKRLEEKAVRALRAELEPKIEVNGILMTRREWKHYMEDCPHEKFSHPGVKLMDGSQMSICDRCKFIQHEAIAKMIEGEES